MSSESKHTIYGSLTALDREDVTRVLWTRTGEWTQASEVEREIEHLRQQRDELLASLKAIVSNSMFAGKFDHCGFMNATALSDRDLFRKLWAKARDAIEKAEGRSDE